MTLILPQAPAPMREYVPIPAGNHFATCYRVIDLGTQEILFNNETKIQHRIKLSWELRNEITPEGALMTIDKDYTFSSHEKSNLRKDLESWRGRPFSDQELGSFDIGSLIGVNCFLNVVHNMKDTKTYCNITSITPLPKGIGLEIRQAPVNPPIYFSLGAFDQIKFDSLPDWIRDKITKSPEYQELKSVHNHTTSLNEEAPF